MRLPLIFACIIVAGASYIFLPFPWGLFVAVPVALFGAWLFREWLKTLPERPGEDDGADRP